MNFYKGIQTKGFINLLKLAHLWDQDKIILQNTILESEIRKVSLHLECSRSTSRRYLRTLFLLTNHLITRKPIVSFGGLDLKYNQALRKLLILTNMLIKGEMQLNNHPIHEQFLFLREIKKSLNVTTERTVWDYYRTLIQLVWIITEKFSSEDANKFADYFSSVS